MQPLVVQNKELLMLLARLPPQHRKKIIAELKRKQLECISEIFSNFLKKKLTKDTKIIKKLKKYSKEIRLVANKKPSLKLKRQTLTSKRGGALLSILLPIAASVISSLLSK